MRPLLRALTKAGAPAHYFGRDWISVAHRPVGWVGFGHLRASARTVVEAIIALDTPFDVYARASFDGKTPATLAELGLRRDGHEEDVVRAYAAAFDLEPRSMSGEAMASSDAAEAAPALDPPWAACVDEAIGPICAGRDVTGRLRVGGELQASTEALRDLEERLSAAARLTPDVVGEAVDAAFGAPHTALLGVRSLASVRDAILAALRHGDRAP